jgi:hypothetical protein
VTRQLTHDSRIIPKEESGSTDEEAEEIGSEGTKPRARKLRHVVEFSSLSSRRGESLYLAGDVDSGSGYTNSKVP